MSKTWKAVLIVALSIVVAALAIFVFPGPQIFSRLKEPKAANTAQVTQPAATEPAVSTEAPTGPYSAQNADLRDCAAVSGDILFSNVNGPLTITGKTINKSNEVWLFVADSNNSSGWIPQAAVLGNYSIDNVPQKDGTCQAQAVVVTQAPATAAPVADPATPAPSVDTAPNPFSGYTACPYKGTGSSQPEKLNVATFKLPDGRGVYAVDLSKLPGCAIVFEGRLPWQTVDSAVNNALIQSGIINWDAWNVHFIIDLRSVLGNFDPTTLNAEVNVPDQYKNWFVYSEGSIYFYDPTWNISDFKTPKPSISQELEVKKFRDAMKPDGYNYPRVIMNPNGAMTVFWQTDSGDAVYKNGIAAGCTKTDQPEMIPVYGLWDGTQFSAAIGAGNCRMVYWADGSNNPVIWDSYQKDGKTIVSYQKSVIAYMFPYSWSLKQVHSWIDAHPGGK